MTFRNAALTRAHSSAGAAIKGAILNAEQYRAWSAPFRSPGATKALTLANRVTTMTFYVLYPILLIMLALQRDLLFVPCLVTPAITFMGLSTFRKKINAPRPYEVLDIDPIIKKDTRGKSFPSRHVFSAFVITMCWLAYSPLAGGLLLTLGVFVGAIRVAGGVHFPKDVIGGALMGMACGFVGVILPAMFLV